LRDQFIDEDEKELDRLCVEFLVRQQPVAKHLRFVYAALKINNELERIGDYAESIARQVLKISSLDIKISYDKFRELAGVSIGMVGDTMKAFLDQDPELARRSMALEEKADVLRDDINRDLYELQRTNKLPLAALTPLLTIARRYERAADQAKNMCEEVLYMCTGEYMKHLGTQTFRVLFVDDHKSSTSQMAEGIGSSLDLPNFVFSSAGLRPQPVDPRTVEFMTGQGIDITRQSSCAVDQIPNFDQYQIIVALTPEAQAAFPPPPTKTVSLDWSVPDPAQVQGDAATVRAAYTQTFKYIESHIRDLAQAMLGEDLNHKHQS
jgi:phosphate transport system protein